MVKACGLAIDAINASEPEKVICQVDGKPTTAAEVADTWHLWDPAFIVEEAYLNAIEED